ncbi:flagellar motor switch protein FliN [Cognatishimia activa]|uniref:Flagellar motor switch protein FliN n=1 Tax=Cognatishimia activa TaxID=1715691 RepID=A0A0P1IR40_9RHOB|nr:flagellar motor switch protein FliN [Cognatishimia activa]CUI97959.1 Flagellar motor switch protein FliN [Cognatishimia activa]CUK25927.1 Flagellar motor switch protein FliN [Cognatishimia activa]
MSEDTPTPEQEPQEQPDAAASIALEDGEGVDAETLQSALAGDGRNIDALYNVKLDVRVVLGRSRMSISDLLELTRGSVIELDRKVGDPIDIMINDRMVARGDLVKVNGDFIGVALREIVKDFIPGS